MSSSRDLRASGGGGEGVVVGKRGEKGERRRGKETEGERERENV